MWTWPRRELTNPDEFEAGAGEFLESVAWLPRCNSSVAQRLVEFVPSTSGVYLSEEQVSKLCSGVCFDFAVNGHSDVARWLLQYVQEGDDKTRTAFQVDVGEFFGMLPDRSAFEEALFQNADEKILAALTVKLVRESQIDEILDGLIEYLKEGNVRWMLMRRSMLLVPVALSRWGIAGAALVVDGLKAF